MIADQEAPFAVQIEPTEGCNLDCTFCGLNGIREKAGGPYSYMTVETAERIASQMRHHGWNARVEFAMHGEPTMHTDLPSIIRTFRKYLPRNQLMVTSNGGGLLKNAPDSTLALFSAGLNILALDYYERVNIVPKLLEKLPSTLQVKHYPQDGLDLSPHRRWPTNTKVVLVMQDIEAASAGGHSTLNNHCGAGAPLNNSGDGKRCAKPFRELSFRWDGNVSCCCNDFRGVYQIGNIHDMTLKELWNHERFVAIRKALYHGQRFYGACKGCDALSTRVGLLPDKYGKQSLPEPSAEDIELMRKASVGSYTPIVLRAWEK